jgi:hypothetical protein
MTVHAFDPEFILVSDQNIVVADLHKRAVDGVALPSRFPPE